MRRERKSRNQATFWPLEWALLISAIAGGGWVTAVSTFSTDHPYARCVGLMPVFAAIRILCPSGAAMAGLVWGISLLFSSFVLESGSRAMPWELVPIVVLAPAGYASAASWLTKWIGFSPYVLAVGWMFTELGFQESGFFPKGTGPQAWVGSLIAPLLAGFSIAWVNAVIVEITALCVAPSTRASSHIATEPYQTIAYAYESTQAFRILLLPCRTRAPPTASMATWR